MPAGLPSGVAMSRAFFAKVRAGAWTSSGASDTTRCIVRSSAVASTSAGAPSRTCATRSCDPAYENRTSTPVSSVNRSPTCSNAVASDAAAKTVIGCPPASSAPSVGGVSSSVQAVSPAASTSAAIAATCGRRCTGDLQAFRRAGSGAILGPGAGTPEA
jgi:hypothetical protein